MTHTALLGDSAVKDLSPIGKQPYRFLTFSLTHGLTVGVLANIFTRIDLIYKALVGSNLPEALHLTGRNPRASVVEIETPPYCVRWTFSLSVEESVREYTNPRDIEGYTRLFTAMMQQLPAYVRGDFAEEE